MRKLWEIHEKVMRKSWESHEKVTRKSWKFIGKSWESHEKVLRKSWGTYEKVMRKSWASHEKVMRNSCESHALIQMQTCLFLSVQLEVTLPRPEWVATRPWAFQAKAMLNSDRWCQKGDRWCQKGDRWCWDSDRWYWEGVRWCWEGVRCRHGKCHDHRNQRSCKIFQDWGKYFALNIRGFVVNKFCRDFTFFVVNFIIFNFTSGLYNHFAPLKKQLKSA